MKLVIYFAATQAALVDYELCNEHVGWQIRYFTKMSCQGKGCKFNGCAKNYHRLKTTNLPTAKNTKCKFTPSTGIFEWTKELYDCATCANIEPLADNSEFDIKCSHTNSGGYQLKKCTFQCKNGEKIQPMNKKKMANVMCKCRITEFDNQCHWSKGSSQYDLGNEFDFSNWKCGKPENIQSGLKCTNWQAGDWGQDSEKIIGGIEARPHSWPFIAHLGTTTCSGTIIDSKTILTAAHCCVGKSTFTVSVGDHYKFDDDVETRFVIPEGNILIHPTYNDHPNARFVKDVCLLKLAKGEEITFGPTIQPACLPNMAADFTGATCWTAGWGQTFGVDTSPFPNELREVDVDIFPQDYCTNKYNDAYDKFNYDPDVMVCAGKENGGKDACQGDSGGPLICAQNGQPVLYGVTSWGFGCAEAEHPGIYAKVNAIDINGWIVYHMGDTGVTN